MLAVLVNLPRARHSDRWDRGRWRKIWRRKEKLSGDTRLDDKAFGFIQRALEGHWRILSKRAL